MEWTKKEFFAKGGTTAFVDRLCGALGIHASTVKVVGVYEGSLSVNYEITPSKDEPLSLDQIKAKQTEKFATGKVDLGAPVLELEANGEKAVEDGVAVAPGFAGKVLVKTSSNQGAVIWYDWLEPWCWEIYAWFLIESPGAIFFNFISLGLTWLWNELAIEVEAMAVADGYGANDIDTLKAHTDTGGLNNPQGSDVAGTGGLDGGV